MGERCRTIRCEVSGCLSSATFSRSCSSSTVAEEDFTAETCGVAVSTAKSAGTTAAFYVTFVLAHGIPNLPY